MHFTTLLVSALALPIISIASPSSPPINVMRSVGNGLEVRQSAILDVIVQVCEDVVATIISDVIADILDLDAKMHAAESSFTQQTVASLEAKNPGKNILVFHNQASSYALSPDAVHYHYELDIGLGFTQGYEIWVFDSGTFSLAGDGGYINWAIEGCFSGPNSAVVFTKC